jgi:Ca-activated chloride channel homolog
MKTTLLPLALIVIASPFALAQQSPAVGSPFEIQTEALGDTDEGVVTRLIFRYELEPVRGSRELYISGAVVREGTAVRHFRLTLHPEEIRRTAKVITLQEGPMSIESRLMTQPSQGLPQMIAKAVVELDVERTGREYVASEEDGPEAFLAEGVIPDLSGSVRLKPPRRDLSPRLFLVEAEVSEAVARLEFWIDDRKVLTRNAPPYRAELDLGSLPRAVEIRVIGYDRSGRFIDADAWVVSERESPIEVRITRNLTATGETHVRVSVQSSLRVDRVELYAEDRRIARWIAEPYAILLPEGSLDATSYLRATAWIEGDVEASDLLYLSDERYFERVEVNLIEFPVMVLDRQGRPVGGLERHEIVVKENGLPVELAQFGFSEDLPLSIGVLIDQSGSMLERLDDAREAGRGFLERVMKPGDRAFAGGFAWSASDLSPFVSDAGSLRGQFERMDRAEGGTALHDAIVSGLYRFRNVTGRKALVVISDGDDTVSRISQEEMVNYVRASRVPIYFIGIGLSKLDFRTSGKLRRLSDETGGVTFLIRNPGELESAYESIEAELRSQYLVGYYTESSGDDRQYRSIEVTVPSRDVQVRAIRGYKP